MDKQEKTEKAVIIRGIRAKKMMFGTDYAD